MAASNTIWMQWNIDGNCKEGQGQECSVVYEFEYTVSPESYLRCNVGIPVGTMFRGKVRARMPWSCAVIESMY